MTSNALSRIFAALALSDPAMHGGKASAADAQPQTSRPSRIS